MAILQGGVVKTCSYLVEHQLLPQFPEFLDAHGTRCIKLIAWLRSKLAGECHLYLWRQQLAPKHHRAILGQPCSIMLAVPSWPPWLVSPVRGSLALASKGQNDRKPAAQGEVMTTAII